MNRRLSPRGALRPAAAAAVLAVVLAACGGGPGASQSPVATTTVDLPKSYRFVPAAITVVAGAAVTWTNHDNFTHTVTFDGEQPQRLSPGETVTHAFSTPGAYHYICSLHPQDMQGSVLVTAS